MTNTTKSQVAEQIQRATAHLAICERNLLTAETSYYACKNPVTRAALRMARDIHSDALDALEEIESSDFDMVAV